MLKPNQRKFRKNNKGRSLATIEAKSIRLKFGTHGIQALEKGRISARQIEAVRRTITNILKRKGIITLAEKKPPAIKQQVAINEGICRLDNPIIEWPEVQPPA